MATSYSDKLKSPRWQKKRLEILNRDEFTCTQCGDKETMLHVHHLYYERGKEPWDYLGNALTTLCAPCHEAAEYKKHEMNDTINKALGLGYTYNQIDFLLSALLIPIEGIDKISRVALGVVVMSFIDSYEKAAEVTDRKKLEYIMGHLK